LQKNAHKIVFVLTFVVINNFKSKYMQELVKTGKSP
jgi:hypothetical protein